MIVAIVIPATTVNAAAPHIIIFHGSRLNAPVVMGDWGEIHRLMACLSEEKTIKPEELSKLEYVDVALFWGPEWLKYKTEGGSLKTLTPEQANQKARLYLSRDDAAPLFAFDGRLPRSIGPDGVGLLVQHGIPVKVVAKHQSQLVTGVIVVIAIAVFTGLVMLLIRKRTSSTRSREHQQKPLTHTQPF